LSEYGREGLHLIIDIGASTVDVCSFILHTHRGSNRYSLLTADVQLLGVLRLHGARVDGIKRAYERRAQELWRNCDPCAPIALDVEQYLISKDQAIDEVKAAESAVEDKMLKIVGRVVRDAKMKRDPHSHVWREGEKLPVVLIGGGSKLEFFRRVVEELGRLVQRGTGNEGVELVRVPLPSGLRKVGGDGTRLTVAWGLSHRSLDIGDIIPADRVEDVGPLATWEAPAVPPRWV